MKPYIATLGDGPDLVLLHGWAMHGGIFGPLIDALAGHFRLHVVDLPGHGHSHALGRFELADTAGAIAAVLVVAFMVIAYGMFGVFANVALVLNVILIFGALSAIGA